MLLSRTMKMFTLAGLLACAGSLTGCASQAEIDRLYETNRSLQEDNTRLSRERDEAIASLDLLRKGAMGGEGALATLTKQNQELQRQLDKARADLAGFESRISGLQIGRLDAETDQALADMARQYSDIMTYDPESGMLRFNSDLTFDSGQVTVKPAAKQALQALAQVLNSTSAAQYEIWVVGHTDSQRIAAPGTLNKYPTNRHLSAGRGISVIEELSRMGVPNNKMMAAGWGEFRPAVENTARGNTPANRRVEIYLAKARSNNAPAPAASNAVTNATPDRANAPTRQDDFTK